ncbi:MAG: hypothetical protein AMXMBFR83_17880 [Phycisphaerae bacterium]
MWPYNTAFRYIPGPEPEFQALPGYNSQAFDVKGLWTVGQFGNRACYWDAEGNLNLFPGVTAEQNISYAIATNGQVTVGSAQQFEGSENCPKTIQALWTATNQYNINDLLINDPPNLPCTEVGLIGNPKVVNDAGWILSSSTWGHVILLPTDDPRPVASITSAYSRKHHGVGGMHDIALAIFPDVNTDEVECRKDGPTEVVIEFSDRWVPADGVLDREDIIVQNAELVCWKLECKKLTLTLANVVDDSCVSIALIDRIEGNVIYFLGPVSIRSVYGDTTGDGSVNVQDILQTRSRSNPSAPVTHDTFRSDVNLSGYVNSTDIAIVQSQSGGQASCSSD